MIELKGKYNDCKIFTDNPDSETLSQIMEVLNLESCKESKIRIMPDCHAGAGCVIGTTMTLHDKVIPNLVGVDIGCGMLAIKLNGDIDLNELDNIVRTYIPSGRNIHERYDKKLMIGVNIDQIKAPIDVEYAYRSIGTLGGGNHFIELDEDFEHNFWLVIHSGSRHLGVEVAKYYQEKAYKNIKSDSIKRKIDSTIAKLKSEGKERDIENTIKIIKMQAGDIRKDLCHVSDGDFDDYIHDMIIAQEFANVNRLKIASNIIEHLNVSIVESFSTIHNYIDTDNMILRKGAVSARYGEKLIIPMNMRDGSLICIGKGNPDWNYSAPHGAGRLLSRAAARRNISFDDFKESMNGIFSSTVVEETIDESAFAYKPMEEIINNIGETVVIKENIKPVYNFKATDW